MLLLGQQRQRTCKGLTRRAFLEIGGSSVLGLSLADLFRGQAQAAGSMAGSAKSVIFVWLWGGPAHLDTWDPKPNAPLEFRGPFSPIATKVPGIKITELFPQVAQLTDQFAIIRSLHTGSNDHGIAGTIGLTGSNAGGVGLDGKPLPGTPRPTTGSVIARVRSAGALATPTRVSSLPPFMVIGGKLHQGKKTIIGEGGGNLGALYDPFRLEYDPVRGTKIPGLQLPEQLTPERLKDRQRVLEALDEFRRRSDLIRSARALDAYQEQAFNMLTSPAAMKVFDLAKENPKTVERYGKTRFGQSCLLARRLVESGVPFVQVNWSDHVEAEEDSGDGGWDHHYRNFQIMQDRHAQWLDQTLSALLADLRDRGLLQTTLVVVTGEFGRSPKINDKAGRDHWEHCFSALMAGGGVRGGRVVGSSDARGDRPHDNPQTPDDVAATIYHSIGITTEQTATLRLDVTGKVIDQLF